MKGVMMASLEKKIKKLKDLLKAEREKVLSLEKTIEGLKVPVKVEVTEAPKTRGRRKKVA
jgi:predicted  nucleic acid-binding Zn-ribbon protein